MAGRGANQWLDADLPEVMALRYALLPPPCPRMRHADLDLSQPGWWQRLGLPTQRSATPVLLVCEGVLMYLPPAQVHAVLAEFAQHAPPGSRMVLDVMTRRAVGCAARHASVRATGAEFRWGVGRMAELEAVHPRLQRCASKAWRRAMAGRALPWTCCGARGWVRRCMAWRRSESGNEVPLSRLWRQVALQWALPVSPALRPLQGAATA
ncbi:MAG: class I SAM-dependent methyltransferase [Paenacidovorax caeni]